MIHDEFITKQELADAIGVHRNTIGRYLKQIGITTERRRLSPKQVKTFMEHYQY